MDLEFDGDLQQDNYSILQDLFTWVQAYVDFKVEGFVIRAMMSTPFHRFLILKQRRRHSKTEHHSSPSPSVKIWSTHDVLQNCAKDSTGAVESVQRVPDHGQSYF